MLKMRRRWWLGHRPTESNELLELELLGAWEPSNNSGLCCLVKEKKPKMVFLMETKLCAHRLETIRLRIGFDSVFVVDCVGKSEGLALLWKSEIKVEIQNYSRRHVNVRVWWEPQGPQWKFMRFYGQLVLEKRRESWSLLKFLCTFKPVAWL
jgi:hypothetical protein